MLVEYSTATHKEANSEEVLEFRAAFEEYAPAKSKVVFLDPPMDNCTRS